MNDLSIPRLLFSAQDNHPPLQCSFLFFFGSLHQRSQTSMTTPGSDLHVFSCLYFLLELLDDNVLFMLFHLDALSQSPLFPPNQRPHHSAFKALTYAYCYAYMCCPYFPIPPPPPPLPLFTAFTAFPLLTPFHLPPCPFTHSRYACCPSPLLTINTHVLLISLSFTDRNDDTFLEFNSRLFLPCTFHQVVS